jgi:hypothetical protein
MEPEEKRIRADPAFRYIAPYTKQTQTDEHKVTKAQQKFHGKTSLHCLYGRMHIECPVFLPDDIPEQTKRAKSADRFHPEPAHL